LANGELQIRDSGFDIADGRMRNGSVPVSVLVAQVPVSLDIERNLEAILAVLDEAEEDDLIVLPEGALSGYSENPSFLEGVDVQRLSSSLRALAEEVAGKGLHVVFGSCLWETGGWYNAGLYFGPAGERFVYHKVNLATSERGHFTPGSRLEVVQLSIGGRALTLGIQLCREIRYPEQWRYLARAGVQVFAYLTNAVDGDTEREAPVWRSHLVSRAAENQRFVLAANNAAPGQKCPSMIVAPDGRVVWEVLSDSTELKRCQIDLAEVSGWYLSQTRDDVV